MHGECLIPGNLRGSFRGFADPWRLWTGCAFQWPASTNMHVSEPSSSLLRVEKLRLRQRLLKDLMEACSSPVPWRRMQGCMCVPPPVQWATSAERCI